MSLVNKKIIETEAGNGLTEGDPIDFTDAARVEVADTGLSVDEDDQNVAMSLPGLLIGAGIVATPEEAEDVGYQWNLPTWFAGSPEGEVRGKPGRICWDTTNDVPYSKDSGTGDTGWVNASSINPTDTFVGYNASGSPADSPMSIPAAGSVRTGTEEEGTMLAYTDADRSALTLFGADGSSSNWACGNGNVSFLLSGPSSEILVQFQPTASDATTPHILDTLIEHTSGNLVEFKNNGSDKVSIGYDGSVVTGSASIYNNGDFSGNRFVTGATEYQASAILTTEASNFNFSINPAFSFLFTFSSGNPAAKFDQDSTAGNTRMFIWDVDNGTLERVTVGAADSGGVGYKVLRIPN